MLIMTTLWGWKHGFASPFRSGVYFLNTRPATNLRRGTAHPVTIRDPDFASGRRSGHIDRTTRRQVHGRRRCL